MLVITGEEGAGKTFTAKLLMENLMSMRGTNRNMARQVEAGWTIMRSLGSAATIMNRSSSRMVMTHLIYLQSIANMICDLAGPVDGVSAAPEIGIKTQTKL